MAVGAGLVRRFGRQLHAMVVFYIGLDRDRDMGLQGVHRLVHPLHRILLVVAIMRVNTARWPRVAITAMFLIISRPPRAGRYPMDNDRIERHIKGTRGQAVQPALVAIKVHQARDIGTGEEKSKDRANKRPSGHISQP